MKFLKNFFNKNKISKECIDLLESLKFQKITKCQECDVFFSANFSKDLLTYNFECLDKIPYYGAIPSKTPLCSRCKKPYDAVVIYQDGTKEYSKTSAAKTFKCDENGNEIK